MKRCPYTRNKWRWKWFQSFKRSRRPGLGPFEEIVSHRAFFRDWRDPVPPILTPKPAPRSHLRFRPARLRPLHLHRDPRFNQPVIDDTF